MSERRVTISLMYSEFENIKKCLELTQAEIATAMKMLRDRDFTNPILRLEVIRQNLGFQAGADFYFAPGNEGNSGGDTP